MVEKMQNLAQLPSVKSFVTNQVHGQGQSNLCWCYTLVTCLHNAILLLLEKENVEKSKVKEIQAKLENTHRQTVERVNTNFRKLSNIKK